MSIILTRSNSDQPNTISLEQLNSVYDGSLPGLNIGDVYRFYNPPNDFIAYCAKKISIGEKLFISGIDIFEFSRKCFTGDIDLDKCNRLLYVNGEAKNCLSLDHICVLLESLSYKIDRAYYSRDIEFVVEATRHG